MGDRAGATVRTGAVLRRRGVPADLRVGVQSVLVVVELRVLDDDGPARVGARVADRVVLDPGVVDGDVAHLVAGPDVLARVTEVAGVGLIPRGRSRGVRREDAVLGGGVLVVIERRGRRQVAALVAVQADGAAVGPAVPPDLVARVTRTGEEVAGGQVVDGHPVRLPDDDPVAAHRLAVRTDGTVGLGGRFGAALAVPRLGPVDHHGVTVHAAQVDVGRGDHHAPVVAVGRFRRVRAVGRLVVVAGGDQDPVAGGRGVDGGLDAPVLTGVAVERAHEEDVPALSRGRGVARRRRAAGGQQCGPEEAGRHQCRGAPPPCRAAPRRDGDRARAHDASSPVPALSSVRRRHAAGSTCGRDRPNLPGVAGIHRKWRRVRGVTCRERRRDLGPRPTEGLGRTHGGGQRGPAR